MVYFYFKLIWGRGVIPWNHTIFCVSTVALQKSFVQFVCYGVLILLLSIILLLDFGTVPTVQYFLFYSFKSFSENAKRGTFTLVWSIVSVFQNEDIQFLYLHVINIFFSIYARNIYCHKYKNKNFYCPIESPQRGKSLQWFINNNIKK